MNTTNYRCYYAVSLFWTAGGRELTKENVNCRIRDYVKTISTCAAHPIFFYLWTLYSDQPLWSTVDVSFLIYSLLTVVFPRFHLLLVWCSVIRQGTCSSHLTLFLNFVFVYFSSACWDLKITMYIFPWYLLVTWSWHHTWKKFAPKNYKLVSMEREFYADHYLL